jgi:hypothetical protein
MFKRAGRKAMCRALLLVATAMPAAAIAQVDVVTERYDDARLGANLAETTLTTSNVDVNDFGKLWSYTVSGSVYAQPLYVHNVTIPGQGAHNVLYVVTMNDMLYAFDADSSVDAPLASLDISTQVPDEFPVCVQDALGFNDNIIGNIGIESTPVIDLSTNTIYLLARTEKSDTGACGGSNRSYAQRLHALDLSTFEERPGSPVDVGGSVPGNGSGSQGGMITFDPKISDQRSSLALTNGRIFIAWSAHSDQFSYHGWVMAYDAATLQQTMIFSSAPDGQPFNGAGIWMGGRAPAVDADGNVYYSTGNGTWDGVTNFGESFIKFGPTPDAPLLDWFTPDDVNDLNDADLDLGGSGPSLVPGTDLIVSGGKSGVFYVTHTGNLGHRTTNDVGIVQSFDNSNPAGSNDQIKGGQVYWNRDGGVGPWMYVWSDGCNHFNAYHFNGATFDTPPASQSTILSQCGSSGGVLTLSANGSTPGSGIVWSSMVLSGDGNSNVHAGILRAFDADNLSTELWNSQQNSSRDNSGNWPKFSPPTVVNGHVYLGSFPNDGEGDTSVNVYGLLAPQPDFSLTGQPANPGTNPGGTVSYTLEAVPTNGFSDPVHFEATGLPDGVTATFTPNDAAPATPITLELDIPASLALGEYTFTVTATTNALVHDTSLAFYVTDAAPGAGVISIDFVGGGTAFGAAGVAGVVAKPNWTEAAGTTSSAIALLDESGVDTGATLAYSADATGALALAATDADFDMMNGYLDADGGTITVTVANLPVNPDGWLVYVYADGDNGATDVSGDYAIASQDGAASSAQIVDASGATFDGTYIEADPTSGVGNYAVMFAGGTGFTLTVTSSATNGGMHIPLNGIQVVRGGDRIFANGFDP